MTQARIFSMIRQFFKYGIVGVINTGLTLSLIFLTTKLFHMHYMLGNGIGYFAGFINSFILNRAWTFKGADGHWLKQFVSFTIVFLLCYGMQLGALYLMVDVMAFHPDISQLLAMVFYTMVSFLVNRIFVFTHTQKDAKEI